MKCIFIFRRDLRLTDNTGLIEVLKKYKKVLPVFIYDHNQFTSPHKSAVFTEYQEGALADLDSYLRAKGSRLCKFYGTPHKVVAYLIKKYSPDAVAFNVDYSNYSIERDKLIAETVRQSGVECHMYHDVCQRLPFHKAYHHFIAQDIKMEPRRNGQRNYDKQYFDKEKQQQSPAVREIGRREALSRIRGRTENFEISIHLKLGLVSTREVYNYGIKYKIVQLIKQMLWREFFFSCWLAHKNNYEFYDERFARIKWRNSEMKQMWTGRTGFAYIDASVNQLNKTGFMPNRNRLIVAYFSIKILHINPFLYNSSLSVENEGEVWNCGGQQYFSIKLADCCYANNTGNWHWIASDTVDAAGMRFNAGFAGRPFKIEPKGEEEYIKQWHPGHSVKKIVDPKERYQEWRSYCK